jgi:hypothetical protein
MLLYSHLFFYSTINLTLRRKILNIDINKQSINIYEFINQMKYHSRLMKFKKKTKK